MAELSKYEQKAVEDCKAKMAGFKANFEDLQKFVKDVIIANFGEFELLVHMHISWHTTTHSIFFSFPFLFSPLLSSPLFFFFSHWCKFVYQVIDLIPN